ncbi:MAG: hypothetical protein ACXWC3_19015 [Burkholderiales bacterium]
MSYACTETAYSTFWEGTDNADFSYWIEDGLHVGVHYDGTCGNGVQFYWADNRPGGGYHEHYPGGSVGFGTNYAFKIFFDGGSTWEVDRNGNVLGYSTSNPCCSTAIQAGGESHTDDLAETGEASGLQKFIGSSWSYNWPDAYAVHEYNFFYTFGTPASDETYSR